ALAATKRYTSRLVSTVPCNEGHLSLLSRGQAENGKYVACGCASNQQYLPAVNKRVRQTERRSRDN
ncbi:hypothetical protein BaRGS_00002547, partial [Batillaria attramentaria]